MCRNVSRLILPLLAMAWACTGCITGPLGTAQDENNAPEPVAQGPQRAGLFSAEVSRITFELDYQPDARPHFVHDAPRQGNPFALSRSNIRAMFKNAGSEPELSLPDQPSDMNQIPAALTRLYYSQDDLKALAATHRGIPSTQTERSFYVIFLDGYYKDGQGEQPGVLGVSVADTGVIAMFKPVIDDGEQAALVEQLTLIRLFGHAAGLVDNGIVMQADHQDEGTGKTCSYAKCVMHHENRDRAKLVAYVAREVEGEPQPVLFDEFCLRDLRAEGAYLRGEMTRPQPSQ